MGTAEKINLEPPRTGDDELALGTPLQDSWWKLLIVGVIYSVLGLMVIAMPLAGTLAINVLVGVSFIIAGAIHIIEAFQDKEWGGFFFSLIWGAIYALGGAFMLVYPMGGAITLTLVLSVLFLVEGIMSIVMAMKLKPLEGWGWIAFSGLAAIILSAMIFLKLPSSATWAIGLLVGINMLTTGIAMTMFSFRVREVGDKVQDVRDRLNA